jgi:hypothetical protein
MSLLVDVARTQDGRIEGRIRTVTSDLGRPFSGVLELLKVLEDCLDHDLSATETANSKPAQLGQPGHSQNEATS